MSMLQWGLIAAVLVLLVVWAVLHRRSAALPPVEDRIDTVAGWPPQPTRVLTSHERVAYDTLSRALPEYIVLAQVPMARFLSVPKRNSYADWLRRLGYQCVDFVVCDKATQVVAVVELQPAGGPSSARGRKRAARIERALIAAGVKLLVWSEDAVPGTAAARVAVLPAPAASAASAAPPPAPIAVMPATPKPGAATPSASAAVAGAPIAVNPFDDLNRDASDDETIEVLEPPQSTWFDDLDSGPTPLRKH